MARRGKGKARGARSQFLSALMGRLAGDSGEEIAKAFVAGDEKAFRKKMDELTDKIVKRMQDKESESTAGTSLFSLVTLLRSAGYNYRSAVYGSDDVTVVVPDMPEAVARTILNKLKQRYPASGQPKVTVEGTDIRFLLAC